MSDGLVYRVKPPPSEVIAVGDTVHELRTHRTYTVLAITADAVVLGGPHGFEKRLDRAAFDAVTVYGGEGMRVYGKVTRVRP